MKKILGEILNALKSFIYSRWVMIIFIVVVISVLFYWYQIRPAKIYSKCGEYSKEDFRSLNGVEARYKYCVRANGINK